MPARIKYDSLFNALLTCFAYERALGTPEQSNEYYRKLTERIDEYIENRVKLALEKAGAE